MSIIMLILRIIEIILSGESSTEAVTRVSQESGVRFGDLWNALPKKYK